MAEQHRGFLARLSQALHRDQPARLPDDRGDDEPVDPSRPHEFAAPDGLQLVGDYLAGRIVSGPRSLSTPAMGCALCHRPADDPIHTPID